MTSETDESECFSEGDLSSSLGALVKIWDVSMGQVVPIILFRYLLLMTNLVS